MSLDLNGLRRLHAHIVSLLSGKVDKVDGKGLSTNDYTTTEKTKLAGIATGANKTTVDTELSGTSTNPVQNKAVKAALDGRVPTSRKINGKALTSDITLSASDIGAAESSHSQAASTITAGTFAGAVVAQTSSQTPATSLLRNSKLVTSESNPSYNGEICWMYE